jgi:hypothetical protein
VVDDWKWTELTVEHEQLLRPFFDESIAWISSCDSYITDLVHRQSESTYTIVDNLLVIRRWEKKDNSCGNWALLPPLFRVHLDDPRGRTKVSRKIAEVMQTALQRMPGSRFDAISDKYLSLILEHFDDWGLSANEADQGEWDYIYSCEELIALKSSSSLLEKRRRLRSFDKRYSPTVLPLAPECWSKSLLQKCIGVAEDWVEENSGKVGCLGEDSECFQDHAFTLRLLQNFASHANMRGVLVEVEGKPVAMALVEINKQGRVILSHVEKALLKAVPDGVRGVYPFTLCAYLKQWGEGECDTVNREQDDGLPGLRTSKHLYKPAEWRKKWIVTLDHH